MISEKDMEPWMKEFVQGRHSQEEWDSFFKYAQASKFQRFLMRVVGAIAQSCPFLR